MALPPTIPTSFVPKQPVTAPRKRTSGANPFLALSYIVVGAAVIAAAAVFGYQFFLDGVAKKKANDVVAAQGNIDQATVTSFIRLRDRFTASQGILANHVALSQFFDLLERVTVQGVQFHSLQITVTPDRTAKVTMTGSARSFNTLAAQSNMFSTDSQIKRAIFSGITLRGGTVAFNLTAELAPSLVTARASAHGATPVVPASLPVTGTSTPAAATTTAARAATTTP